jgi:hypothetical protein
MVMRLAAAPLAARGALARAAGLRELAGAASVVTAMMVIFSPAGRGASVWPAAGAGKLSCRGSSP